MRENLDEVRQRRRKGNWFEKMDGFLNWKVIGPDIHNPFGPAISDRVLLELAHKRDVLRKQFNLRCMCDGHEVLMIKNIEAPQINTDHPCISELSRAEIFDYLDEHGVTDQINKEMDRVQQEIKDELKRRELELQAQKDLRERTRKTLTKDKADKFKKSDNGFRIVRR